MTTPSISDVLGEAQPAAGPASQARVPTSAATRTPVCILLDTSASMAEGGKGDELHKALDTCVKGLRRLPAMYTSMDLAIVTMGVGVSQLELGAGREGSAFTPLTSLAIPDFEVDGVTQLGDALELALDLIEAEMRHLHAERLTANLPNLVVVTDGCPTDADGEPEDVRWREPLERIRRLVAGRMLLCTAVGFRDAPAHVLEAISGDTAVHLGEVTLDAVIRVVSASIVRGEGHHDRFQERR